MTKAELFAMLAELPDEAIIMTWNPDVGMFEPVTGCESMSMQDGTMLVNLVADDMNA